MAAQRTAALHSALKNITVECIAAVQRVSDSRQVLDGWWWVGGTERQEKGQAAAGGERMGKEPGNGKGWQWQAFPHQAVGAPAAEVYGHNMPSSSVKG